MIVLSIDPGIRGAGAALWVDRKLVKATYVPNTAEKGSGPRECATMASCVLHWADSLIDELVVEHPQTYAGRASRGDANDLFPLAGVDAALAALLPYAKVTVYVPRQWKASIEKPANTKAPYIIEMRVRDRLAADELACIEWPKNVKHTWDISDGVGIGLYHFTRFDRRRIYAVE